MPALQQNIKDMKADREYIDPQITQDVLVKGTKFKEELNHEQTER